MSDDVHQIQGTSDGEMVKGDWHEFHVNIGKQYPVKLATKMPDIIAQAQAAGQSQAVWTYKESEGAPNPHRPGENFKNRYLQSVEVGGTVTQAASAPARQDDSATRSSIERQTIVKAAIPVYTEFADDDLFFAFLERLAGFVSGTPVVASESVTEAPTAAQTPSGGSTMPSDDIPFEAASF